MGFLDVVGQGIGAYFDNKARGQQVDALKDARRGIRSGANANRAIQGEYLGILRNILSGGQPTLDLQRAGTKAGIEQLRSEITREPGTSAQFQRGISSGTRNIVRMLAQYGISPSSGVFGRAEGELTSGLIANDQNEITSISKFLSGLAPNLVNSAVGFGGLATSTGNQIGGQVNNIANNVTTQGAVNARYTSSLGERFGNVFGDKFTQESLMKLLPLLGGG